MRTKKRKFVLNERKLIIGKLLFNDENMKYEKQNDVLSSKWRQQKTYTIIISSSCVNKSCSKKALNHKF